MRLTEAYMLDNGTEVPTITGKDRDGNDVTIGELTAGSWSVVLFYRGHW